jgi:hypothetical protein
MSRGSLKQAVGPVLLASVGGFVSLVWVACAFAGYAQRTPATIGAITTQTKKAAPDGTPNTRTKIAVSEKVTCSVDPNSWNDLDENLTTMDMEEQDTIGSYAWTVTGGGMVNPSNAASTEYTAPDDPATVTLKLKVDDSGAKWDDKAVEVSVGFTVIGPTGESSTFLGHLFANNKADFKGTLSPGDVCFGNVRVQERTGAGSADDCWVNGGSGVAGQPGKWEAVTPAAGWDVQDNNTYQSDTIGWSGGPTGDINWYRTHGATVCKTRIKQEMFVDQGAKTTYQTNDLDVIIFMQHLQVKRGGADSGKWLY